MQIEKRILSADLNHAICEQREAIGRNIHRRHRHYLHERESQAVKVNRTVDRTFEFLRKRSKSCAFVKPLVQVGREAFATLVAIARARARIDARGLFFRCSARILCPHDGHDPQRNRS